MNCQIFHSPAARIDSCEAIATLHNVEFKDAAHYINENNRRVLNDVSIIFLSDTDLLSALNSNDLYELHTNEGEKFLIRISQNNGLTKSDAGQYTMYASQISKI